ncbi:MAG: hypothetical protein ACREEP_08550 [Dongiaceae bacterium]
MIVIGEGNVPGNRKPSNPERKPLKKNWWDDAPQRPLGPHDGRADRRS